MEVQEEVVWTQWSKLYLTQAEQDLQKSFFPLCIIVIIILFYFTIKNFL